MNRVFPRRQSATAVLSKVTPYATVAGVKVRSRASSYVMYSVSSIIHTECQSLSGGVLSAGGGVGGGGGGGGRTAIGNQPVAVQREGSIPGGVLNRVVLRHLT